MEPFPKSFKDRKSWLVVFGVLTIFLGAACVGILALSLFSAFEIEGARSSGVWGVVCVASIYGILAVVLIWLGVGSILCRRWARALLLVFSWAWLVVGILSLLAMGMLLPRIMRDFGGSSSPQDSAIAVVVCGIVGVFMILILLLLPAAWTFFYSRPSVKLTCERRDPKARWTDRRPLPVLGLSLLLGSGGAMMLGMAATRMCVVPLFGRLLVGWPASAFYVALAAVWGWSALACFKLRRAGWWVAFCSIAGLAVSSTITYAIHDIGDVYRALGYPAEQIALMERFGFTGGMPVWLALAGTMPWIGFLLFIRGYFRKPAAC